MRKLLLLLALFFLGAIQPAYSQITYRGSNIAVMSGEASKTPTEDGSSAENDFMILWAHINKTDGVWTDPTDFTELDQLTETLGVPDARVYIGWKKRASGAGDGYQMDFSGSTGNGNVGLISYSGVDGSTPFDVTYSNGSHYAAANNDMNAAAAAITTVSDDSMVVLLYTANGVALTGFSPPSGYGQRSAAPGSSANMYVSDNVVESFGPETPGLYGHTGTDDQDPRQFTVALREAGAGGGGCTACIRRRRE